MPPLDRTAPLALSLHTSLPDTRTGAALIGAVSLAMLLGALGSQVFGGLAPCELCHWQRWPHALAPVLCLAAIALPRFRHALLAAAGIVLLAGAGIAAWHVGVEAGWLEGTAACTGSLPENLTTAELLTWLQARPVVACDVPAFVFLGLSMAGWNALGSTVLGTLALVLAARRARMVA